MYICIYKKRKVCGVKGLVFGAIFLYLCSQYVIIYLSRIVIVLGSIGVVMIKCFQKKDLHDDRLVSSLRAFGRHDAHSLGSSIPNATYMTNLRAWSILTQDGTEFLDVFSYVKNPHDIIGKDLLLSMRVHDDGLFDLRVFLGMPDDVRRAYFVSTLSDEPSQTGDTIDITTSFWNDGFETVVDFDGTRYHGCATMQPQNLSFTRPHELIEMATLAGAISRKFASKYKMLSLSDGNGDTFHVDT